MYNIFRETSKEEAYMEKTTSDKALEQVLLAIEKQFGKGSVMKLGDNAKTEIDTV